MTIKIVGAWAFPSSSGSTTYETTLDEVSTLACNCPGFVFKRAGQARSCKHTKQVAPYTESVLLGKLTVQEVAEKLGIAGNSPPIPTQSSPAKPPAKQNASSTPFVEKKGRLIDFEE